jgi:hypothetical protein
MSWLQGPSPLSNTFTSDTRRFAVALSFPGEHRAVVEPVAAELASIFGAERILYDKYHDAEFARPDLDIYLPRLYREQSELLVVFLCPEYSSKRWCQLEWRHIRQLIATVDATRIMFVSVASPGDLAAIGVLPGDGYIDIDGLPASEISKKIATRYRRNQEVAALSPLPFATATDGSVTEEPGARAASAPASAALPNATSARPALPKPDWSKWGQMVDAVVHEVVALSCNIDPKAFRRGIKGDLLGEYFRRSDIARNHIDTGNLNVVRRAWGVNEANYVRLTDFATWATSLGWTLPDEFPGARREGGGVRSDGGSKETPRAASASPSSNEPRSATLAVWRDKLAFLLEEEAKASDAEQKFSIRQRIAEARTKIRELEG